jgi:hypothetical protein
MRGLRQEPGLAAVPGAAVLYLRRGCRGMGGASCTAAGQRGRGVSRGDGESPGPSGGAGKDMRLGWRPGPLLRVSDGFSDRWPRASNAE